MLNYQIGVTLDGETLQVMPEVRANLPQGLRKDRKINLDFYREQFWMDRNAWYSKDYFLKKGQKHILLTPVQFHPAEIHCNY